MSTVIKLNFPAVLALATASVALTVGLAASAYTIDLASAGGLGEYLVDQDGMTLYYSARDDPGSGFSSCGDACIQSWPPFHTGQIIIPADLSSFDFGTISREDGSVQTTYKGWPLYYYVGDYVPGEINGHGMDGIWFAAGPNLMP